MKRISIIAVSVILLSAFVAGAVEVSDLPQFLNTTQIDRIAPQPADQPDRFRFVVIGDTRDGDAMFEYLMDLAQDMKPLFIINVGDLVHSGKQSEYEHYYDQIKDVRVPYISVVGNHEAHVKGGLERYVHMFGPTDGYFDVGNSRFIYFDNAAARGYTITDEQLAWIEGLLQTDKKRFLFMHAPPGIRMWNHGMGRGTTEKFFKLMDKYAVERVYFGHVHAYDRFVRNETTYMMIGCGGAEPDPLGERFYNSMSGGFYHFNIVEVQDNNVLDVLVAPNTEDIIDFRSPKSNLPLEYPFAGYRHFNTPIIDNIAIKDKQIKLQAYSNPKAFEAGITGVTLDCFDTSGAALDRVRLIADFFDERDWSAAMPATAANCILSASDPVRSSVTMLPSIHEINPALGAKVSPGDIPFYRAAVDPDDPSETTIDDMDLRSIDFAYDDKYFYFRTIVDGVFSEGDRDPRNRIINIYGFILLDDTLELEADISKMLGSVPLLAYAPLANTLSIPKCSIIDARGFREGKFSASDKGVKCMAKGNTLFIRAERDLFGDKDKFKGFKLIAATLQLLMKDKMDADLGDASNPADIRLQGIKQQPQPQPQQ